jgi:hypothetical protein
MDQNTRHALRTRERKHLNIHIPADAASPRRRLMIFISSGGAFKGSEIKQHIIHLAMPLLLARANRSKHPLYTTRSGCKYYVHAPGVSVGCV